MTPKRIKSKKTGRGGWEYRFTDPLTKKRVQKTIWITERREADKAMQKHLDGREARLRGLPDNSGWEIPFDKLVDRFLREASISTPTRRERLRRVLERNELNIQSAAELTDRGKLSIACQALAGTRGSHYVIFDVQRALKQLTRWANGNVLPLDPLQTWERLPWTGHKKRRRAFLPDEMRAILAAADEYDGLLGHSHSSRIVFTALLVSGNRPGALFAAKVGDLSTDRIVLPPGNGIKRNGMSTIPPAFIDELRRYSAGREHDSSLLLSHQGEPIDRVNIGRYFQRCMTLAFVNLCWPKDNLQAAETDPAEVAFLIYNGRLKGFDGPRPIKEKKIAKREAHMQATEAIAKLIGTEVGKMLADRDMYTLRKTHISWARRIANPDSVKLQVGHAPQDTEEKFYLDLVDAHLSSQAVWDVLTGAKKIERKEDAVPLRLAVGAELQTVVTDSVTVEKNEPKSNIERVEFSQELSAADGNYKNVPGGIRTSDLSLRSGLHPDQQHASPASNTTLPIGKNGSPNLQESAPESTNLPRGGDCSGDRSPWSADYRLLFAAAKAAIAYCNARYESEEAKEKQRLRDLEAILSMLPKHLHDQLTASGEAGA